MISQQPGTPTSASSSLSTRNKEKVQNILRAPARPQRQPRKSPYPIWRLVEGACVMTELDWGDGMACWITTLVSWLGIRVPPSWWAPGPAMAPPTVLCIEIFCPEKTEGKVRRSQCFTVLSSSQRTKLGIWLCQLNKELWLLASHGSIHLVTTYNYEQMKNNYLP